MPNLFPIHLNGQLESLGKELHFTGNMSKVVLQGGKCQIKW